MKKIIENNCGVYKITNTETGATYVGSSRNIKHRWSNHKCLSTWLASPTKKLYQDMQELGTDKFEFELVEECKEEDLIDKEQKWIDELKPAYNTNAAKAGEVGSKYVVAWEQKHKAEYDAKMKSYYQRTCEYNGEKITYNALVQRLRKLGVKKPNTVANTYVVGE